MNVNQVEYGSRAVAVPVRDSRGHVVAAINCSAESPRVEIGDMVRTRLPALLEVARKIEGTLARYPALTHSLSSGID